MYSSKFNIFAITETWLSSSIFDNEILPSGFTKKHLPADEKYWKYYESAVVNLTSMIAIFLSSVSKAVIISAK